MLVNWLIEQMVWCLTNGLTFLADGRKVPWDCLQQHCVHSANSALSHSVSLTFVFTRKWDPYEDKKIIKLGGGAGGKQEEKPIGQLDTWMQPAKHEEEAFLITFN